MNQPISTITEPVNATEAQPSAGLVRVGLWLPTWTLWQREMVRFFRQRSRVIGALATPLIFWLLLGAGLNRMFVMPGADGVASSIGYMAYFFPGTVVLVLLFTAIFSTITVIEDRREGFMQGVVVAPAPRLAIVLGKVLGGASIATIQGVLFLALWPLVGKWPGVGAMLMAVGIMFVLAMGLTALGLCIAWPMDSTAAFHAVMNLFLMPMWFLSGAVFPLAGAPVALRAIMYINPLTYGQAAFASMLLEPMGVNVTTGATDSLAVNLSVTLVMTAAIIAFAVVVVNRRRKDGAA